MVTTTEVSLTSTSLSTPGHLSLVVYGDSSPDGWASIRDSHIDPLFVSELNDSDQTQKEFLAGAELLGLQDIHPRQLMVASVIGAGQETVVIEMPRRSSKSTSILCVLLVSTTPEY